MRKNFVLDTNVLLHDPRALFHFAENDVVVPIYVIEEIDQFKRDLSELGRNARQVARYLDQFRSQGRIGEGVKIDGGSTVRVAFSQRDLPKYLANLAGADNRILAVAMDVKEKQPDTPTIFVTKDTNLRIRADALGLTAEDYDTTQVEISDIYTGVREVAAAPAAIDEFYNTGELTLEQPPEGGLAPNEFVLLRDRENAAKSWRSCACPRKACGAFGRATRSRASRSICS
jgi:PhoH-like ATPase